MQKNCFKTWWAAIFMLPACTGAQAYDFEKDGIYYNVTSLTDLTVEVTNGNGNGTPYTGDMVIPETVEWKGKTFAVSAIGGFAFSRSDITSIELPASVKVIGYDAFSYCYGLSSVTFPEGLEEIDWDAFGCCYGLSSVTFPESLEKIDGMAFLNCSALTEIILPDKLETIENDSFKDCSKLASVTLPVSLTSIGQEAFSGCVDLRSVTMRCSAPPVVEENSFPFITYLDGTLYVPQGSAGAYQSTPVWNSFSTVTETEYADPTIRLLTVTARGNGYVVCPSHTLSNRSMDFYVEPNSSIDLYAYPEEGYRTTFTVRDDKGNDSIISGQDFTTVVIGEEHVTVEVTFEQDGSGVADANASAARVYVRSGKLVVENADAGGDIRIYDTAGRAVRTVKARRGRTETALPPGQVYIVKIADKTMKVAI